MSLHSSLGKRRWRLALAATALMAFVVSASSSATIDRSFGVRLAHSATAGDCNANGTPDAQESVWANRDDDGDGLCNGIDVCPVEADASNSATSCQMQAMTVPFRPGDPSIPHPTYSGATITLKGIARYGANQFMWDFGDGSALTAWVPIANPYNLGVRHVYTGPVGHPFVATLFVRNSSNPSVVSAANYRVRIEQSSANAQTITDPAQLDVRAQVALDEGLWYLHLQLSRSTFTDGSPGYRQNYGFASSEARTNCAVLDAFELHGSSPARGWSTDPYAEDVQRSLAFVLASGNATAITSQQFGNPDTNGNGLGVFFGGHDGTYDNAVCAIALADSGTPETLAPTGPSNIYNRRFGDLAQDTVDWFAFGQADGTSINRGGWGYTANDQNSISETFRWPILAMGAAEREQGATVPAFVRGNIPFYLAYSRSSSLDTNNGGWGWQSPSLWPSVGFTAGGIVAHEFLGDPASHSDVQAGLGFLYRHWNDAPPDGIFGNLGDSDAMFTVMRAMQDARPAPLARITDYDYNTGQQTANGFDWYHAPAADPREGIGVDLVRRQQADGSWNDTVAGAGTHGAGTVWSTAWDTIILGKGAAMTGPIADIGGPYVTEKDTPTQLDASRSVGTGLTYTWDLDGNGTYGDATGATPTFQWATYTADAGGVSNGTVHNICVRVTDTAGRSDSTCTAVTVKPPPHPPVARLAAAYSGAPGLPIQFSASGSTDVDGDPLTFAWDFHNNGSFTDATGVNATSTFNLPGTYVVCVRATDHPDQNAVPYTAPSSSSSACAFLTVGSVQPNHPPVASIVSPSVTVSGPLPRTVTFDASPSSDPDGDPLTYSWTFDDPGTSTGTGGAIATHTFASFGSFTAHVTVSDGLLTSSADATIAVVDTTPGIPSGLVAGPVGTGVGLTWSVSPNATSYEVFRTADGGSSFSSLGSVPTASFIDPSASAGGTYVYEVSASSAGGTSARSAPASITLAPATPTGLAATESGGAVSLTWTSSTGATGYGVFRSSDGGATYASLGPAAGASFFDAAVVAGETYRYEVTASNAGGSSDRSAAVAVSIPLPAPSLTEPLNGAAIVGRSVHVSGAAAPGATVAILDGVTGVATLTADGSGGFAGSVILDYGHHTLTATQTKGAVASAASAAAAIDVVPEAPTLVASSPVFSQSLDVFGQAVPGATVDILEGATLLGSTVANGAGDFQVTVPLSYGMHELRAQQMVAGETSAGSAPVHVAVVPPAPALSAPVPGFSGIGATVGVTGTGVAGASVAVLVDGLQVATLTVAGDGTFSGTASAGYGHHTIAVSQAIGGQTSAPSAAVGIDLVPAAPTLFAPALSRSPVAVSGRGAPGAQVTVRENGVVVATFPVAAGGGFGGSIVLADGAHVLSARQSIAGAVSADYGPVGVRVDTIAPTVSYTGNAGRYTADQTVAIHCLASDGGSGLASSTCHDIAGPAYSFGVGSHTYTATATDLAGNSASATVTFTVSVTEKSVCRLAKQFVQGSAKYRSLPSFLKGVANGVVNGLCEKLDSIEEHLSPARKTALLKAYALEVTALARVGWLTGVQADTLKALALQL